MKQNAQIHKDAEEGSRALLHPRVPSKAPEITVALLTGGGDKPYVFGLRDTAYLQGRGLDLIGSDELDFPGVPWQTGSIFLNLRGDQRPDAARLRRSVQNCDLLCAD